MVQIGSILFIASGAAAEFTHSKLMQDDNVAMIQRQGAVFQAGNEDGSNGGGMSGNAHTEDCGTRTPY